MCEEIKNSIQLALCEIQIESEDDDNGVDVLRTNLKKAEELRIIFCKAFEDANNLCQKIENWIEDECL